MTVLEIRQPDGGIARYLVASIYGLIDPRTRKVRYIGMTMTTLEERLKQHMTTYRSKRRDHPAKSAWIEELARLGLQPEIRLLETAHCPARFAREIAVIEDYLDQGADLVNRTEAICKRRTERGDTPRPVVWGRCT